MPPRGDLLAKRIAELNWRRRWGQWSRRRIVRIGRIGRLGRLRWLRRLRRLRRLCALVFIAPNTIERLLTVRLYPSPLLLA
jgi:hypothetical protein|tara:strand:- start:162 stop:404 length:243 start_codon:yes stop_codon:yes gene_type:complete